MFYQKMKRTGSQPIKTLQLPNSCNPRSNKNLHFLTKSHSHSCNTSSPINLRKYSLSNKNHNNKSEQFNQLKSPKSNPTTSQEKKSKYFTAVKNLLAFFQPLNSKLLSEQTVRPMQSTLRMVLKLRFLKESLVIMSCIKLLTGIQNV